MKSNKIQEFKLERYFAKHEFTAKYLLSSSDCDSYSMSYILEQSTKEELSLWNNLKLGYTEIAGHPLLRKSIAEHYNICKEDDIVVASPGELNYISMNILLDKGDHVVVVSPSYQSLYEVANSLACEVSFWKPNENDWTFEIEDLKKLVKPATKMIIINFPHNPTGTYITKSELDKVVAIAIENDCYLFSDEMYRKLNVSDMEELPPVCDLYEKGISLWGTSKTFGLAGLRTGWIVSQDKEFLQNLLAYKDYLSICNSAPAEILTLIALNHIEAFVNPNIEKIKNNIRIFEAFQRKHKDIFPSFIAPKTGSTAFIELNYDGTALEFSDKLVKETGIMTIPSEMFEYTGKYLRIGFGRENLSEVLDLLDPYLDTLS